MRMKKNLLEAGTRKERKGVIKIEKEKETEERKGVERRIVIATTGIEARGGEPEIEMMMLIMKIITTGRTLIGMRIPVAISFLY